MTTDIKSYWYLVRGELLFSGESSKAFVIALVDARSYWYTVKGSFLL